MARRFRLGDVIVERFEIIIRIERECAQPAESVCVEPAMRIFFAERFELSDGDLPRFSQCLFVLRRPLRAPGGRERAARAHEHRHFGAWTLWKFFDDAVEPILTFFAVAVSESVCAAQIQPVGFDRARGRFRALIELAAGQMAVESL